MRRCFAKVVLPLLFLPTGLFAQQSRSAYFPKEEVKVDQIPKDHSKVWIFMLAGQSNMAGRGYVEPQDTIPNQRILTINTSGDWIEAKAPLDIYDPKMRGLGMGMSFAKNLLSQIPNDITLVLIPCAVGGTSIDEWSNDASVRGVKLLSNFETQCKHAQEIGVVKGILWHQGEADALEANSYPSKLDALLENFRSIVGNPTLPVVIGELGVDRLQDEERHDSFCDVNEALNEEVLNMEHCILVSSKELKLKSDHLHFTNKSQRELGKRYAEAWIKKGL